MAAVERLNLLSPGHRACPGCGAAIALRLILRALGKDTIVVSATGCVETFTSPFGQSAWEVPWMHSLFENSAAVASGIEAALEMLGEKSTVAVISGDGGTFDIGMGAMSGMFERKSNILYICYDNEAYMNTGVQRSGATPFGASTTTSPPGKISCGKIENKKDLPAIAVAHDVEYVATASIAYPQDLMNKIIKGKKMRGPKYIQVHTPCNIGWGFEPSETIEIARLAVETGMVPIFEMEKGKSIMVKKIARKKPVEQYLKKQNRFKHLFNEKEREDVIRELQRICDYNISRYGI
ncbi:MAG: thiamine pyrophosphate-dependent enzyme [Peptococcaceae bacterium]|nr:thiamine pyrophosphate-dependent enzyme [Peptococcaceae bacterium]MDH7525384.1 thiamine pyrophosphate-dependent enzyme [Peptococcaceae bacterium]